VTVTDSEAHSGPSSATEHTHDEHTADHPATSTGLSNEKLAMWAFLGSECLLFGALISVYLLFRGRSAPGTITPKDVYDIPYTSVSAFVLLMSSLTMVLALANHQRGDFRRFRVWILTTALLGATFVGGQMYEFTTFYDKGLKLSTNLFGSSFYVLTGFHGVHVVLGILMLMSLFTLSLKGRIPPDRSEVIELGGLYWHFVDVVWIIIFTLVYLVP
jgi:cytochrome c oxidase subunit 3/cytochrome o ubiquinol oxidase subunit 3